MPEEPLSYAGFVRLVLEAIEEAEVPYMIGGAVAAWAWGEPRATRDLDVVIHIPAEAVGRLSASLTARGMPVPVEIILDHLIEDRADLPLSAVHAATGYKADIYLLRPGDELREEAFRRRRRVDMGPALGEVYLHSPEDLILYKLWYYSLSQQTKHLRDIAAIVLTLGEDLDDAYIRQWAQKKGLNALWEELLERIRSGGAEA